MIIDFYLPDGTFLDCCTETDNNAGKMLRLLCRVHGAVVVKREVEDVPAVAPMDDFVDWMMNV